MAQGVMLSLLLLARAQAQGVLEPGVLRVSCGLMATGRQHFLWFMDLNNQINHASRLTILTYEGQGSGQFTKQYFEGLNIQPSERVGSLVMWRLGTTVTSESTHCTLRSDATVTGSYNGQCGTLGFAQELGSQLAMQGTLIQHIGSGQSTAYTSIEDCCIACASTSVAARQLQEEDTCAGFGFREVPKTYLSGSSDTVWASATPLYRSDVDCCRLCKEAEGCAGFSIYQDRCYLTMAGYVQTAHAGARAFVAGPAATPYTNVGLPPPPPVQGLLTSAGFQVPQASYAVGRRGPVIASGPISAFRVSLVRSTPAMRREMCTQRCVARHTLGNVRYVIAAAQHSAVGSGALNGQDYGVPMGRTITSMKCYCYSKVPDETQVRPFLDYRSSYVLLHYAVSSNPPSPPPPPRPPPLPPPAVGGCSGFVVEGAGCRLYDSHLVAAGVTGSGSSVSSL